MKFACFADSPLHVFNIVNFVWHDVESSKGNCDLYIHKQFPGYENMIPVLRRSGLFRNVIECSLPVKSKESRLKHACLRTAELFFPKVFLKKWTRQDIQKDYYDVILMPAPLRFSIALADVNRRKAKIWFYEDGTASYYGDILDLYGPKSKHLLKILFNKGHETVVPERMYINNTALSATGTKCELINLPAVDGQDSAFMSLLDDIFGADRKYDRVKIVYLSVPVYDINAAADVNREELFDCTFKALLPYNAMTIVRPHPRETKRDYYGLPTDRNPSLWELICARSINDNTVLIGSYSTAQLMPKLMFDKEPVVVFTYKIYKPTHSEKKMNELEGLIERLRSSYRNPERIYNVSSIEEYYKVISSLLG